MVNVAHENSNICEHKIGKYSEKRGEIWAQQERINAKADELVEQQL